MAGLSASRGGNCRWVRPGRRRCRSKNGHTVPIKFATIHSSRPMRQEIVLSMLWAARQTLSDILQSIAAQGLLSCRGRTAGLPQTSSSNIGSPRGGFTDPAPRATLCSQHFACVPQRAGVSFIFLQRRRPIDRSAVRACPTELTPRERRSGPACFSVKPFVEHDGVGTKLSPVLR